jgi:hypothetical protein
MPKSHDRIAKEFEKATNIPYNPSEGVDFKKRGIVANHSTKS